MNTSNSVTTIMVIFFMIWSYITDSVISVGPSSPQDISCHRKKCYDKCKKPLPTIRKDFHAEDKTIFFIETSCKGGLQSKYACAVESAANANQNWNVIVLFAGPLKPEFLESKTYAMLNSIPNLNFYRLNSTDLAIGTPLEEIFLDNLLATSKYPVVHAADLLRILVLHLFGGIYLDLDMIVMRSFDSLPKNFIARQDGQDIAAGVIAAAKDEIGRKFTDISMRIFADIYNGDEWSDSLYELNLQTLEEMCLTKELLRMNSDKCQGFHLLEPKWFYPIHYIHWKKYYKRGGMPVSMDNMDIEPYTHHMWNSFGRQVKLPHDSFFTKLAEVYCQKTYNLYKDKFGQ